MEWYLLVFLLLLLTACSGLFSASETALFSLSHMRVRLYKHSPSNRKRLIAGLVLRPRDLLVTILMLNVLVNILVQNMASNLFGALSGWSFRVGVPLALTLVFGEVIPKSIAIQNNQTIAHAVAPIIYGAQRLLGPLQTIITTTTSAISRLMFFFLKKEPQVSKEELEHVLKTSEDQGLLHRDEAELIKGYLDLRDGQVQELMRPREDVLFYDIADPLSELCHLFVDQECSRIPVCEGELDKVIGVITAPEYLLQRHEITDAHSLRPFLAKPFFVPETMLARHLIRHMDESGEVLAMVVDEYGSVTGLIAREDLVEVVVGDIEDRRDQKSRFTEAGQGVIIASGKLELSEFEEVFGIELKSDNNMVTLGGWLTEQLGDIPKSGTNFVTKEFLFHVLAADANRVRRVYVRRMTQPQGGGKTP